MQSVRLQILMPYCVDHVQWSKTDLNTWDEASLFVWGNFIHDTVFNIVLPGQKQKPNTNSTCFDRTYRSLRPYQLRGVCSIICQRIIAQVSWENTRSWQKQSGDYESRTAHNGRQVSWPWAKNSLVLPESGYLRMHESSYIFKICGNKWLRRKSGQRITPIDGNKAEQGMSINMISCNNCRHRLDT